jgi:hypothetical protein
MSLFYEKTIRQGLGTVEDLIKQELITSDELPVYQAIETCPHTTKSVDVIVTKCSECGRVHYLQIDTPKELFARIILQIRQGLMDAETVTLAPDQFTADQLTQLETIVPCGHLKRRIITCCGGSVKEECVDCGRRFADQSQWILTHTEVT